MNPIFIALDTSDLEEAFFLGSQVREHVGGLKLGLEFYSAQGRSGVERMASLGLPLFLDLKLHDIPNTVGRAIEALKALKPSVLTVHAAGGAAMLKAAKAAAGSQTKVIAVTVLTSLDADDLGCIGVDAAPADQVVRLAMLARDSGIDGVVCSGAEVALVRGLWPDGFFIVPGIRLSGNDVSDQKRVVTPAQAVEDGASLIVVGRPVTGAADPASAAAQIAESLNKEVIR